MTLLHTILLTLVFIFLVLFKLYLDSAFLPSPPIEYMARFPPAITQSGLRLNFSSLHVDLFSPAPPPSALRRDVNVTYSLKLPSYAHIIHNCILFRYNSFYFSLKPERYVWIPPPTHKTIAARDSLDIFLLISNFFMRVSFIRLGLSLTFYIYT